MSATTPPNPAALDFLLTRRSRPFKTLAAPVPDAAALRPLLAAAARTPDHGKLEPWRFIVLSAPAMVRISGLVAGCGEDLGKPGEEIEKMRFQLAAAPLAVAVISSPKPPVKIPLAEQRNSAAAACLGLLNAALAAGWGANWLTGWAAHDAEFCRTGLGLTRDESLVGFVHIGTARATPPDRPRPDIDTLTTWIDA